MTGDQLTRLEREIKLLARQVAGLPIRIAESGGGGGGKTFTAFAASSIGAGSATDPTSGTGTVYEVAADGTTTEVGVDKTLWNPYEHGVKGSLSVSEIDGDNYQIVGYDLLQALWLRPGAGARKLLGTEAGASSPTDLKFLSSVKCGEVV